MRIVYIVYDRDTIYGVFSSELAAKGYVRKYNPSGLSISKWEVSDVA
jgi:hypothetical protein